MESHGNKPRWAGAPTLDTNVLEELRAFSSDEDDLAEELMALFLEDSPVQLLALQRALRETDLPEVERRSHRLKGSAGSIGAIRLREICAELESEARSGAPSLTPETAMAVSAEMESLSLALCKMQKPKA